MFYYMFPKMWAIFIRSSSYLFCKVTHCSCSVFVASC